MRAIVPFLVTTLLICITAPFLGVVVFGALTGTPQLVVSRDLAGVPMLLYAAIIALPVALPVGIVASIGATAFGYLAGRRQPLWVWVISFGAAGAVLGSTCAFPMIFACVQQGEIALARAWLFVAAICGVVLMILLSGLWLLFFRDA
jgi:hypothetical protein